MRKWKNEKNVNYLFKICNFLTKKKWSILVLWAFDAVTNENVSRNWILGSKEFLVGYLKRFFGVRDQFLYFR